MESKLRIGVVITEGYQPEAGGGFGYYESLMSAIDQHQFDPLLEFVFVRFSEGEQISLKKECITFSRKEDNAQFELCKKRIEQVNKIPVKFIRVRLRRRIENRLNHLILDENIRRNEGILKWLSEEKIDILYYPITFRGGELNFPFVATHWDIGHCSMFAFPEVSMDGIFEKRERYYYLIYKKAFAVFCESEAGKEELATFKQINPERIFVLPLFPAALVRMNVNESEQQSILESQFSLSRKNYFLYPAQFWGHKNHYHLLIAFKMVVKKNPGLKLILPGSDKGNLAYIRDVVRNLELQSDVIIPGYVSNATLYSLYKNAIALVMPTLLGPTNMPLLEAAEIGCPVITSDFKGHRELLGDYATYIDPLDENAIADAMIHALKTKHEEQKIFVNNTHSISSAVEKLEDNFLRIRKVRKMFGNDFKLNGIA